MDRIFKYFNTETADDIDLEEWIVGFSVILKGRLDFNIYLQYNMYTLKGLRTNKYCTVSTSTISMTTGLSAERKC